MKIHFPEETLGALLKAGVKSPVFETDTYRGLDIDSKFIAPDDIATIKRIVRKDEFWSKIENRRIIHKIEALEKMDAEEGKGNGMVIHKLELLSEAIRRRIEKLPHKWVFRQNDKYDVLLPFFVSNVQYHPPENVRGGYIPAYVDVQMGGVARGGKDNEGISLQSDALPASAEQALSSMNIIVESEELIEEYEKDLALYKSYAPQTGEQFSGSGLASVVDGHWHTGSIHLERDGEPGRVVMDDEESRGSDTLFSNTKFWAKKHSERDEEEGEEAYPLPVHPILRVFDLRTHQYVDTHVSSLKPYRYDPTAASKLVLPPDHKELIDALTGGAIRHMDDIVRGKALGVIVLCTGLPGTGKCLGVGTPVLKCDGAVIPVETVRVGDRLMGPDGKARTVLSMTRGVGSLYKIVPIKGEPWVCNDAHVLTLVNTSTNAISDMSLDQWLKSPESSRMRNKLFSVGVDAFDGSIDALPIDPYFLGLWFGDGSKHVRGLSQGDALWEVAVSKPDKETLTACETTARAWGMRVRVSGESCPTYHLVGDTKDNDLIQVLRRLVGPESKIPTSYLRSSRANRLSFLAGLLDADAELTCNCYVIAQKREDWATAIWWLARSVGLCATRRKRVGRCRRSDGSVFEGEYWVVSISGNVDELPLRIMRKRAAPRRQRKTATRTGFEVVSIGTGDYYGFAIDGDGRFLLGDFTVTHNTLTAEVYSESAKRPLYSVQCSQLGTNEERLEKKLQEILDRATRWRAILLIDEADVYIHERENDIAQNAIVGVFLRLLEYFNGILFLTTNRETVIDDAIISRVTAHVRYGIPEKTDEKIRLWRILAEQYGVKGLSYEDCVKEFPRISGRSIRQLIRLARIMADRDKSKVTLSMIRWAAKFHDFSEDEKGEVSK